MTIAQEVTPKTILVIDDDSTITGLVHAILSRDGHTVHAANNGSDGVAMAQEVLPDLILMDITMPGLNGYQVTERLKQIPEVKDIPIIFLTGISASEDGGQAFARGGVSYMRKPFTTQQLRDLTRLVMESL